MMTPDHNHDAGHSHAAGGRLDENARGILQRGIETLLQMTDGLEFRPLPSEKFPFPLASVAHAAPPRAAAVRAEVQAHMLSDPVRTLEGVLALLELYECNQSDMAEHFLEDMPFVGACFSSKRQNGWIAAMGDGDRAAVQSAIDERWRFGYFPGPRRPTGIYILLSMLARYAFVYGPVALGDSHELGHFVEELCPGVIVCCGELSDLELTLSLTAMKMGVPAVVPGDYPFALGRTIRADTPAEVAEAVVGFANIRRLLDTPELPRLPDYCDPANAGEEIDPAVTWGHTPESFLLVTKGKVDQPGFSVAGSPASAIGVTVTIDAKPMDAFDTDYIEQAIAPKLAFMPGVGVSFDGDGFAVHQAAGTDLDPRLIGEVLLGAVGKDFPKLAGAAKVEVVFDAEKLAQLAPAVRAEKLARRRLIDSATEETVDWFIGCTGCSPFAPDHVCIITPQRLTQCGRPIGLLKTNALYSYDDMSNIHHSKLQAGVNSFVVIDKGRCLDAVRGEWSGADAHIERMTQGRTKRVHLHCLDEFPHTGCGCFRLILFKTAHPRAGVGVMDRGYGGVCADGRAWKDLYYELAGKQTPGVTGAGPEYLLSPKFLQAHGGWGRVVWVSPRVAEFMGDKLPAGVEVGQEPDAQA